MKRKLLIWGIALLTVVNVAALATIGYHRLCSNRERHHENRHAQRDFLHRELALSDTQAEQMKLLKEKFQLNVNPIRTALRTNQEQLIELLTAAAPHRSKIDSVQKEIDSLQAELQKMVIDHLLGQKEILTPEQQFKFFSIIRERLLMEEAHHGQNGLAPINERKY